MMILEEQTILPLYQFLNKEEVVALSHSSYSGNKPSYKADSGGRQLLCRKGFPLADSTTSPYLPTTDSPTSPSIHWLVVGCNRFDQCNTEPISNGFDHKLFFLRVWFCSDLPTPYGNKENDK